MRVHPFQYIDPEMFRLEKFKLRNSSVKVINHAEKLSMKLFLLRFKEKLLGYKKEMSNFHGLLKERLYFYRTNFIQKIETMSFYILLPTRKNFFLLFLCLYHKM